MNISKDNSDNGQLDIKNFKYGDKYIESLANIVKNNSNFSKYILGNNRIN
jgi:hypothetical protein